MPKQTGRSAPKRRAKPLNRERVIAGALELIDEDGLDALSMRRLADKLGVQAMTLYSHVANKEELLDGVVVKVLGEVELPSEGTWREIVTAAFTSYRAALLRHPHVAPIIMRRPVGNAEAFLAVLDYSLGVLSKAGLDARAALDAHRILTAFTTGIVMNELTESDPRVNPILMWTQMAGGDRFAHVAAALPYMLDRDVDATFRSGLEMILAGFEQPERP